MWTMNVEIVKKKTTQHFCNGRAFMPAGIMKRKKVFDCYKDKMIQL